MEDVVCSGRFLPEFYLVLNPFDLLFDCVIITLNADLNTKGPDPESRISPVNTNISVSLFMCQQCSVCHNVHNTGKCFTYSIFLDETGTVIFPEV